MCEREGGCLCVREGGCLCVRETENSFFSLLVHGLLCSFFLDATVSESPQLSERERELLELKKFDLNWHFGPCTGMIMYIAQNEK